jgi:hypothetical protein
MYFVHFDGEDRLRLVHVSDFEAATEADEGAS